MYILFYLGPNTFVISLPYWPVPYQTKYLPPFPSLFSSSPPMIKHVPPFNLPFSPFYSSPFTFLLFLLRRNISPTFLLLPIPNSFHLCHLPFPFLSETNILHVMSYLTVLLFFSKEIFSFSKYVLLPLHKCWSQSFNGVHKVRIRNCRVCSSSDEVTALGVLFCRLAMFRPRPGDHCQRGWGLLVGCCRVTF